MVVVCILTSRISKRKKNEILKKHLLGSIPFSCFIVVYVYNIRYWTGQIFVGGAILQTFHCSTQINFMSVTDYLQA